MESDLEALRRSLAQAMAEKEAAEARAASAEAAAEARAAAAEAATEAAVEAGHKREYLAALRGVSASASENSSVSADTARRGAPEPVEVPLSLFSRTGRKYVQPTLRPPGSGAVHCSVLASLVVCRLRTRSRTCPSAPSCTM